ncbi:hypothetical protein [Hyphomicrobium sp.]|jgi:hypothetical protein|uniref:hypothetical protein n=1 Tax=Hyphomicrobium sp. TaxID=82 RepID=UPI00356AF8C6
MQAGRKSREHHAKRKSNEARIEALKFKDGKGSQRVAASRTKAGKNAPKLKAAKK